MPSPTPLVHPEATQVQHGTHRTLPGVRARGGDRTQLQIHLQPMRTGVTSRDPAGEPLATSGPPADCSTFENALDPFNDCTKPNRDYFMIRVHDMTVRLQCL